MTPSDKIKDHLKKWGLLEGQSSLGPWQIDNTGTISNLKSYQCGCVGGASFVYDEDAEYIVFMENNSSRHREVIAKLVGSINNIHRQVEPMANRFYEEFGIRSPAQTMAEEVLSEVAQMLSGEKELK